MKQKSVFVTAFILTLSVIFSSCALSAESFDSFAMGSIMNVKLYMGKNKAEELYKKINGAVNDLDKAISTTDPNSEISAINEKGISKVSYDTKALLKQTVNICSTCGGKLDITIGAVSSLWDFDSETPAVPAPSVLAEAAKTVDFRKIIIEEDTRYVRLAEGQKLDLGAFGKGAALDKAAEVLENEKGSALITFGGAVMFKGKAPNGKKWMIGIRDPFKTANDSFGTLGIAPAENGEALFVSTSGSYEKCFTENGKTYHHILSVTDGYPAVSELTAVTVLANSGLNSDALSTYCFISGLNKDTLGVLKVFNAEAVFIFNDGSYFVTKGLRDSFTPVGNSEYTEHPYEG